jgi:hypothetical protein
VDDMAPSAGPRSILARTFHRKRPLRTPIILDNKAESRGYCCH